MIYSLALAGLSQQAAQRGVSSAEWITQLSADAEDGRLDGVIVGSAQSLPMAVDEFLRGPGSSIPSP